MRIGFFGCSRSTAVITPWPVATAAHDAVTEKDVEQLPPGLLREP